jgi:beta-phosphoglucomutase-like phosphatase (HAD superfamily)
MTITAIVFDMDGLMLDTEPLYKTAWQQASAELGFELDDSAYSRLVGRPAGDCECEVVERFGPGFPIQRFRVRWPELWRGSVQAQGIRKKSGLLELLSFVDAHGLAKAIATSSGADYAEFSLRSAGLSGRFSTVVTGDEVARGKPAPDIYSEAARQLGRSPAECVALEDSDAGVLAASAAGMVTLCVPDSKPPSSEATRAAACVLRSLDDVREWIDAATSRSGHSQEHQ